MSTQIKLQNWNPLRDPQFGGVFSILVHSASAVNKLYEGAYTLEVEATPVANGKVGDPGEHVNLILYKEDIPDELAVDGDSVTTNFYLTVERFNGKNKLHAWFPTEDADGTTYLTHGSRYLRYNNESNASNGKPGLVYLHDVNGTRITL